MDSFFVCDNIDDCLENLLHTDYIDLAVGGSRRHILSSQAYSPSKIYCFDQSQSIQSYSTALYMPTVFDLRLKIDKIIQKLLEGGLFVKWNKDSILRRKFEIPDSQPLGMTFEDISTPFIFLFIIGSVISMSSFICELIIFRKMKQHNRHVIWIYLEQFFDGRRHYFKNLMESGEQQ